MHNQTLWAHFWTQQALASILLSQGSITQLHKIFEDGLHDERCMADVVQDPEVVTTIYAKRACYHCYPGYESSALRPVFLYFPISSTFHPVIPTSGDHITRKRLHLFHASGRIHYVKLVHLYHLKMCTLQDGHGQGWIPFLYRGRLLHHPMQRQVLGWCLVWHDHRTGIGMHTNGFWWAHIRLLNYREHSG